MRYEYDNTDFKSTEYHYGPYFVEVTFLHQCGYYRVRVRQDRHFTYEVRLTSRDKALVIYRMKQLEHQAKMDEYEETQIARAEP